MMDRTTAGQAAGAVTTTARTTAAKGTMATPRTAGTTERASRRLFPQFSVRNRITAGIALLTLAAMSVSGVLVYTLESARIEAGVNEQIDQEIDEFRRFQRSGIDPDTGAGFTDALRLVTVFLQRNVPDDDEMLVAYEGDVPRERTRNRYGEAFLEDPDYKRAVRALLADGGTVEVSDGEYGEVWVTSVPVRS